MWYGLLLAGIAKEKINGQPNTVLVSLWKEVSPTQYFRPIPSTSPIEEVDTAKARASIYKGWIPTTPRD